MPTRRVPYVLFEAGQVHPDDDWDWTVPDDRMDWDEEHRRRAARNGLIKNRLLMGKSVQYKSSDWSMYPTTWSGDCCLFFCGSSE